MRGISAAQAAFIKQVEDYCSHSGLPPSVGRVMGFLMICQPPLQSAEQLQHTLDLSVGSVSNAVSLLTKIGLIEKRTFPGDRRFYYQLLPDAWWQTIETRLQAFDEARRLAVAGLAFDPANPRLQEMRSSFGWLVEQFAQARAQLDKRRPRA